MTIKAFIIFCLVIFTSTLSIGQIKDSLIKQKPHVSIQIAASPLLCTDNLSSKKNIFSFQSGILASIKFNTKISPCMTTGILYDFKKYDIHFYSSWIDHNNLWHYERDSVSYHFLYIPINFSIYLNSYIISWGAMARIPYIVSGTKSNFNEYSTNPIEGLQLGVGKSFSENHTKFIYTIQPYVIITWNNRPDNGHSTFISETNSKGIFTGLSLTLAKEKKRK
jgi:hypothetical protein